MNREEVIDKLTFIFRKEFSDETLILTDELTAADIDNWDSLTHMILISEIENAFSIKFKLKELNKMHNVGDLINFIESKL